MNSDIPQPVRLADYAPYPYEVRSVALRVELDSELTQVESRLQIRRQPNVGASVPLILDGNGLNLLSLKLNGVELDSARYRLDDKQLQLFELPAEFALELLTSISPAANTGDEGLFELGSVLATQCESEGFRRITWFPDRPDVLSIYNVTLVGNPDAYPVMLSNGHPMERGTLADGRNWVRWEDPFPKPSYIFAIVAGDLACLQDTHTAPSGRDITLAIYADHERIDECDFAMGALKRSLRWEEEKYAREFDLDVYNIVALSGHVGAMENKGLNVFDANGICADPEISTDQDYLIVERILAHEVFHNWTGNRVTCRDWFQLSLKEGLTRFRDQCFSQDMSAAGVKRIDFVKALQRNQFPEDDGPAAHPVKPDTYIEIRNFYTGTVYDKGAELVRMLHCLLGDELFRSGVKLYLERYDLQAVTTEEFLCTMEEIGNRDFSQFRRWYHQAGRPRVCASGEYDAASKSYALTLSQSTTARGNGALAQPFHIPVLTGLLDSSGSEMSAHCKHVAPVDGNFLLELTQSKQVFLFEGVHSAPVPSLLRGFSAPVSMDTNLTAREQATLMAHDADPYNRWQAGQALATSEIRKLADAWHAGRPLQLDANFAQVWGALLADHNSDPALLAELTLLPDEPALSEGLPLIDLDGHMAARDFLLRELALRNRDSLLERYHELGDAGPYEFNAQAKGRRSLRNRCLELLLNLDEEPVRDLCLTQIETARNMTDMFSALAALCHIPCPQREHALAGFYQRWQHKAPVIDKWFNAQALSRMPNAIDAILELEQHLAMDLMNMPRAMAFYGGFFRQNRVAFNDASGRAYDMLAERLILVDSIRPGSTYWLMPQLLQWRRFDAGRQKLMKQALQKLLDADISGGLYEIANKALAEDQTC